MAIFAGWLISVTGPAQAERVQYQHTWCVNVSTYPGGPSDGMVEVTVHFRTSPSEASVVADDITLWNLSKHTIVVDADRWQTNDGSKVYRGPGAIIDWEIDNFRHLWRPVDYISVSEIPIVYVHFHAQTRPALGGFAKIWADPVGEDSDESEFCHPP
jgi:hypothetical protein